MKNALWPMAALLALGACGGSTEDQTPTESEGDAPEGSPDITLRFPVGEEGGEARAEHISVAMQIPPALRGRWGMNAADCEPGRADAKGLLAISPNELEFYESVGQLIDIDEIDDSRIAATFAFTGEGMEWEQQVTLDAQDSGTVLIRREYGKDAAPGPFRYEKCP
ncbi:hypothetical protein FHS61_001327 [Altererythrobacter atlanticus]|uniref:Uncharacterized protein n=1 Tax=Croceibacterium atlanticum TaxID=1267766 RepID=A0A0F7KXR7_9SPHN|nr:hypothetical protein [Croceibacterium atlanticum]AKH44012.1 hypothetical protein WYH_02991 [Croceibacterium atlanticum]MBB5732318.1 hypothetical protein [Croceibacterium atlanticum]